MKKPRYRFIILSFIFLVLSIVAIILFFESYRIAMKKIADPALLELYVTDVKTYHTYFILFYALLLLSSITGIITDCISSKYWIVCIPSGLCFTLNMYASATVSYIPLNIIILTGSILFFLAGFRKNITQEVQHDT